MSPSIQNRPFFALPAPAVFRKATFRGTRAVVCGLMDATSNRGADGVGTEPCAESRAAPPATARIIAVRIMQFGAGGGNRTHTTLAGPGILSPVRLPVSPPRHLPPCYATRASVVSRGPSPTRCASCATGLLSSPPVRTSRCGPQPEFRRASRRRRRYFPADIVGQERPSQTQATVSLDPEFSESRSAPCRFRRACLCTCAKLRAAGAPLIVAGTLLQRRAWQDVPAGPWSRSLCVF